MNAPDTPCLGEPSRSGLALVLVVGVLGVLAVLGSALMLLSQMERRAASQRVLGTQALLLARSGIEDAQARLDLDQEPGYGGEDWDLSGALTGPEEAAETYQPRTLNIDDCPVHCALRPSLFVRDPSSAADFRRRTPVLASMNGRLRGYSGRFSRGPGAASPTYALKILRPGFFVNGGDPSVPLASSATSDYNTHLMRILGNLADAIDRQDGVQDGSPAGLEDGRNLVALRPAGGWRSWKELMDIALGGRPTKLDALKPYLTLSAWVDRKVIAPNANEGMTDAEFQAWADITTGRSNVRTRPEAQPSRSAPDFERIQGRVTGRAPVDLDWARTRRPALIALLAGLKGLYLDESTAQNAYGAGTDAIGNLRTVELALDWSQATDDCRRTADAILASTSELATWGQWHAFCDSLPMTGTSDQPQAKRDLLKANFNPNGDLGKFNPDQSMAKLLDKSDLLVYSTEFNLVPRRGGRVSSVGRLTGGRGQVLASRTLTVELAQDRMLRLTAQSEFVAEDLGILDVAGDEALYRAYGQSPYITRSGGFVKTFGHRLFGDPGVSLQTCPEPHTVWTAPAAGVPAAYDGQIRLATVETPDSEGYGLMNFLACWTSGADADYGRGGKIHQAPNIRLDSSTAGAVTGSYGPAPDERIPPASHSLWDAREPGTLRTDGLYIEKDRQPGYPATGNMPGSLGLICFWVKPNYDPTRTRPGDTVRRHLYLNNTRLIDPGSFRRTASFQVANAGWLSRSNFKNAPFGFVIHWESDFDDANPAAVTDDGIEQLQGTLPAASVLPHRWTFLGFLYATWSIDFHWDWAYSNKIYVNGQEAPLSGSYNPEMYSPRVNFSIQNGAPATFYLGRRGYTPFIPTLYSYDACGSADSTLDEFALYDMDRAGAGPEEVAPEIVSSSFQDGRYYRESVYEGLASAPGSRRAGEYFTAPIDLGSARLKALSWTQIVPAEIRWPADPAPEGRVAFELVDVSGATHKDDRRGRPIATFFTRNSGQPVDRPVSGRFRLHAVFQPNLADMGKALLDALALDDVTLTYRRDAEAGMVSWSEGE